MKYESYKKFFSGGFFPVDSTHKLVNLENTGEFSVKATLGSGSDTKVVNHYLPSVQGLTMVEIVAKNLYFDWKDLSFTHQLTIDVYPNDITAKTAIDYFARQTYTAGKPILKILKGSGQEAIYQYALTKSDKFSSISKEE